MGLFWDLYQSSQISEQREAGADLQRRVDRLEREVAAHRELLSRLIERLETRFGEDLDGDGEVG